VPWAHVDGQAMSSPSIQRTIIMIKGAWSGSRDQFLFFGPR